MKKNKSFGTVPGKVWSQYSFIFEMVIVMVAYAFTIKSNGNVFKWSHIAAILGSQNTCIVGTMALGMALVIITGQIDLSIGSSLVLTTGVTIMVFNVTNSVLLMILAGLATGALCGAVNGLLVGLAKMPPFVVTLGTMLIYRSLTLSVVRSIDPAISGSSSSQFAMNSKNSSYEFLRMKFGTGKLTIGGFSVPYITFVFVFMVILFIILSEKTKYGKSVYAVGSNEKSARLAGINVTWVKVSVFILTGLMVGVGSILQACKIGNVTPASSGVSYEMYAIAAVVLGGVSMAGGKGKILGVIFGALSYTTINFIIVSIPSLSVDIQDTFQGLVLIVVILVQTIGPVLRESIRRARKKHQTAK
ncbi:MAG: ABC transporter permease [Clostridiales bacterium]|nr:ABC transporter permease [Candidatus Apopatocola equi]